MREGRADEHSEDEHARVAVALAAHDELPAGTSARERESKPGQNHAVRPAKLGAVGVRISRWVTMHGFAFNASTDRSGFAAIIPCGIRQYDVTTLDELVGGKPQPQALAPRAAELFCERFGADLESYSHVDADDAQMADAIGIPATC
ncbi:MAG: Octanoyltransferase [Deltaproteobacteria bacterium ADurb.Bin207]|nr:MAG: Octanoyltransferase [Deltaproteobacteria bacterium ADurb.Bin207]